MGTNLDFITDNIVSHVWNYDPTLLAAALSGCTEQDCDVRTYGGSAVPNWARFWSQTERSPQGSFWWNFELLGDCPPPEAPPPVPGTSSPFWGFSENDDAVDAVDPAAENEAVLGSDG